MGYLADANELIARLLKQAEFPPLHHGKILRFDERTKVLATASIQRSSLQTTRKTQF